MKSDFLFYPLFREAIDRLSRNSGRKEAGYLLRIENRAEWSDTILDINFPARSRKSSITAPGTICLNLGDWECPEHRGHW